MAKTMGVDCKVFVTVSGVLTDAALVRDNSLGMQADEIDASSRGGGGVAETEAGLIGITADFDMIYDPDDTVWLALQAAYLARTGVACKVLDGGTAATGHGIAGTFFVTDFSQGQPLNGVNTTKVKLFGDDDCVWQ